VNNQGPFSHLADDQLLGLCIDREARGQPEAGRIAVGSVVLNRVQWGKKHKGWGKLYGNTIATVILAPDQFSWTIPNLRDHNYLGALEISKDFDDALVDPIHGDWLEECFRQAQGLISGEIKINTSALYYQVIGTNAPWSRGKTPILTIADHEFYA
jgi:N-acetylmuramoyl-L-alanine amidase